MFLKVITVKNVLPTAIGILIMGSNFQNMLVMVAIICLCCFLMLAILLLSLLKVLTIAAFFMTLPNLMEFICGKILCLKIVDIYKTHFSEITFEKTPPPPPPLPQKKKKKSKQKMFYSLRKTIIIQTFMSH